MATGEPWREFRLLGAFEVSDRGRPLDIGAGKQKALLALLALRAGQVVSKDSLIDALWGERAPASAPNSVHIYVSRLRKALGNDRLETRGRGYLLVLGPDELDLARFQRLLGEGRELLGNGEAAAAADSLRSALALWRGPPLADLTSEPFAQDEIARLEGLRLEALEERIDADLALGRHARLVAELEMLVREHPLRERLRGQLMLALYRSGRQAEALETYRQARTTLGEELGLEPGPQLKELERAILRQDPELDPPPRASAIRVRARRRSGVVIAAGAAVLLAAAAAVAAIQSTTGEHPGLTAASPNAVAAIDVGSKRLVADIPVGAGPTSVAFGGGSVWVVDSFDDRVFRIDPETGAVEDRIDVGGGPAGIAVGDGVVWVANSLDATVSRIDATTNDVESVSVGLTPLAVAADGATAWVTNGGERSVMRIDATRGRVVKTIPTDAVGRGVAVGGGSVWVTDESRGRVVRIDSGRNRVVQMVPAGNGPTAIAFGEGSVWVVNSLDGTVSRIDAITGGVRATIPVGEGANGIAVHSGAVWVSTEFSEAIVRIDPAVNRVEERVVLANRPQGLALGVGRLWLAIQASGVGHRGGRLIAGGGGAIQGSIDPSFIGWSGTYSTLGIAYDGLVGFARRRGAEGTQVVPNLAESLPVITKGDTSLAFRLRRGIRYSDGRFLRASDFRRTFERSYRADFRAESPLVGHEACRRRPRGCDLSRSIRTDDAAGTIVFRLRRPDDEFVRSLAFLWPVPRGTPARDVGRQAVPSTGPYMVERFAPGRALTFVRNPFFRVWSKAARPDGFPDEIELRLGDLNAPTVTEVEQGGLDFAAVPLERPEDVEAFEDFRARFPSRVHARQVRATVLLFLNTRHPPFDDVRVRRAVNFAVDRGAIAASYGLSVPTCQLRPPGTVGFRRYCPYTASPSETGEWRAPDLSRARRLVSITGTRGVHVTVWTYGRYPGFWEQAAQHSVQTLKRLGYRASIGRARDLDDFVEKVTDRRTRGVQAGVTGWYLPPAKASSLLDLFLCRPPDNSFLCDPRIVARIDRALEVESTHPERAAALWEGIERDLVDLAPWAPLFTPVHAHVLSARAGNYQQHPELGVLLDQMWTR